MSSIRDGVFDERLFSSNGFDIGEFETDEQLRKRYPGLDIEGSGKQGESSASDGDLSVMAEFQNCILADVLKEIGLDLVIDAVAFACNAHRFQQRKCLEVDPKDGKKKKPSYIIHPVAVMKRLLNRVQWEKFTNIRDHNADQIAVLIAGLCHDIIEDTAVTYEELKEQFGKDIADLVQECTFVAGEENLSKSQVKKQEVERPKTMSYGATFIKLCDSYDNLSNLLVNGPSGWGVKRIQGYFVWKREVLKNTKRVPGSAFLFADIEEMMKTAKFTLDGETHDALPKTKEGEFLSDEEYDLLLTEYYELVDDAQQAQRALESRTPASSSEYSIAAVYERCVATRTNSSQ